VSVVHEQGRRRAFAEIGDQPIKRVMEMQVGSVPWITHTRAVARDAQQRGGQPGGAREQSSTLGRRGAYNGALEQLSRDAEAAGPFEHSRSCGQHAEATLRCGRRRPSQQRGLANARLALQLEHGRRAGRRRSEACVDQRELALALQQLRGQATVYTLLGVIHDSRKVTHTIETGEHPVAAWIV
jgi:hypothetical protein